MFISIYALNNKAISVGFLIIPHNCISNWTFLSTMIWKHDHVIVISTKFDKTYPWVNQNKTGYRSPLMQWVTCYARVNPMWFSMAFFRVGFPYSAKAEWIPPSSLQYKSQMWYFTSLYSDSLVKSFLLEPAPFNFVFPTCAERLRTYLNSKIFPVSKSSQATDLHWDSSMLPLSKSHWV